MVSVWFSSAGRWPWEEVRREEMREVKGGGEERGDEGGEGEEVRGRR